MIKRQLTIIVAVLLMLSGISCLADDRGEKLTVRSQGGCPNATVDDILQKLRQKTSGLNSYHCRLEYLFRQPLFESRSVRKGVLYYRKTSEKSKLRINFQTLKQDDEKEQNYIEHYIFDGIWLTHIDYQIKQVKKHQLAEPNEPVDVFQLAAENFPIVGFSRPEELKKQFEIKCPDQPAAEASDFILLHLKVKPQSVYSGDYEYIELWLDRKIYLPAKIVAVSVEQEIYQLTFLDSAVNKNIKETVFDIEIPEDFELEMIVPDRKN